MPNSISNGQSYYNHQQPIEEEFVNCHFYGNTSALNGRKFNNCHFYGNSSALKGEEFNNCQFYNNCIVNKNASFVSCNFYGGTTYNGELYTNNLNVDYNFVDEIDSNQNIIGTIGGTVTLEGDIFNNITFLGGRIELKSSNVVIIENCIFKYDSHIISNNQPIYIDCQFQDEFQPFDNTSSYEENNENYIEIIDNEDKFWLLYDKIVSSNQANQEFENETYKIKNKIFKNLLPDLFDQFKTRMDNITSPNNDVYMDDKELKITFKVFKKVLNSIMIPNASAEEMIFLQPDEDEEKFNLAKDFIMNGNTKGIKYLINEGIINTQTTIQNDNMGNNLLHISVGLGQQEILELLFNNLNDENKKFINNKNWDGCSPLECALYYSASKFVKTCNYSNDIVNFLINNKYVDLASINNKKRNAVHIAAMLGNLTAVQSLLIKLKNLDLYRIINSFDENGTPLQLVTCGSSID